ncbi:MAG: hypothetical protein ABW221_25920 [Vicinamibacteria bacterium]
MEWLAALAVLTVTGTFGMAARAFRHSQRRLRREALQRAVSACRLDGMEPGTAGVARGRRGGLRIRVESARTAAFKCLRVTIDGVVPTVQAVSTHRRWSDAVFGSGDVEVGDPYFDEHVVLLGPPATVRGLFTADVRALVREVFGWDARIRLGGGSIVAEFPETKGSFGPPGPRVRALVDLAERLEPGPSDGQRLAAIVRGDPLSTVRVTALETLLAEDPENDLTRAVLRDAARDAAPAVRLKAAQALGDEGIPVLHELAATSGVEDAYASAAISALGDRLPSDRARQMLAAAEADLRVPRARALLQLLAARGPEEVELVTSLLARRADSPVSAFVASSSALAAAAVEALVAAEVPSAETHLVAALASSAPGVAQAAAFGLGQIGTALAVPPLREAERQRGDLRSQARQSIAAIQARLTGATPGQLSLTGGAEGQVSVVDSADGRVSLD